MLPKLDLGLVTQHAYRVDMEFRFQNPKNLHFFSKIGNTTNTQNTVAINRDDDDDDNFTL